MLRKATNTHGEDWDLEVPFVLFNYMNQDYEATGYSPFFLSHGYIPRTPRLVVAPPLAKSEQSASQWAATLSSRLKEAHLGAQARDLQTKQRRVASSEGTCSELHVGDSVMMYVPPKPGFPTKFQNLWQGPYVVVKCLQGNTYRLNTNKTFAKGCCATVTSSESLAPVQSGFKSNQIKSNLFTILKYLQSKERRWNTLLYTYYNRKQFSN